jgi:DNA-binding transcriptional MerR regulator
MPQLTIGEAAARLHSSPSTIRSWEQRLGYPIPERSRSGRRLYDESDIALLSDALSRGLSISSAIRQIQEDTGSHADLLRIELAQLHYGTCDQLLEAAIAMRGVCRAFDEVVLAAVEDLLEQSDDAGVCALAVEWAKDRSRSYRRLATSPALRAVVIADASNEVSALRAASEVLQLQLRLRGFATHTLLDSAILEFRAVAELVDAVAVIFVGSLPAQVSTPPLIVSAKVAVHLWSMTPCSPSAPGTTHRGHPRVAENGQ